MAARSPNISLISSISQKLVDTKLKARPPTKLSATPDLKAKQSFDVSKALTTKELKAPQILIHLEVFETQKQQLFLCKKNIVIAKALVFNSPNKAVKAKILAGLNMPVRTICSAMKKFAVTSGKTQVLGHNKPLPRDAS
nr:hypothetical protein CFP56_62276 [Quercus suber]